jgi:hypothetical protein
MNANELADYLDNNVEAMIMSEQQHIDQAATMLRQQQAEIEALRSLSLRRENLGYFYDLHARQQAEIEALKQIIDANNLSQNIGQFIKPANEPVAWINLDRFKDEALYLADCVSENKVDSMEITTPLYTHPAKTLTDEEIMSEWEESKDEVDFARAILRKAQEK